MRVLIVRTSALGDIVHVLPVLTALRRHHPDAAIGWVIEETFAPLLEDHPDLDRLILARTKKWRKSPLALATLRGVRDFASELQEFGADLVLDLMGNHKAGAICALTMADRRIGLARGDRREPSSALWLSEGCEAIGPHAVDRALSLLDALGLPIEEADFAGERLLSEAQPGDDDRAPYVAILPGAGWANKRYPESWWGEVARRLADGDRLEVRVLPGPGEEGAAAEVVEASGGRARAMPAGGLRQLAASLRGARLVLGGDTGPVHLAHALGVPVLCVMGPTDPERNGPYRSPDQALWKLLPCSFCYRRFDEPKACLLEIPPRTVATRALDLLDSATG